MWLDTKSRKVLYRAAFLIISTLSILYSLAMLYHLYYFNILDFAILLILLVLQYTFVKK